MAVDRFSYNIPLYLSGSSQGGEFVGSTEGLEGVTYVLRKPRGTFLLGLLQIVQNTVVCAEEATLTASMSASSHTNVRVTFSEPVLNNVALSPPIISKPFVLIALIYSVVSNP